MLKKHIIFPVAIGLASCLGYVGFRLKGFRHAKAVAKVRDLKSAKGL
jgi:hypothetical protein